MKSLGTVLMLALLFVGCPEALAQPGTGDLNASAPQDVTVSLDEAWAQAREAAPQVQRALAAAGLAAATADYAKSWWLPVVELGAGYHALTGGAMAIAGDLIPDVFQRNVNMGAGFAARWSPANSLGELAAAELYREAAQLDVEAARAAAHLATAWAYFDLLEAEQLVQALELQLASNAAWSAELRALVKADLQPEFAALLVESSGVRLQADLASAAVERAQAAGRLQILMGVSPDAKRLRCAESAFTFNTQTTGIPLKSGAAELIDPEVEAAALRHSAAERRLAAERRAPLIPTVSVGTSSGVFGTSLPDLYSRAGVDAALTWRLPLDRLFGGGRVQVLEADAALAQVEHAVAEQSHDVQLQSANRALQAARMRYQAAVLAAELAGQALEQSEQRLALDVAEPYEVFHVREVALEAELDRVHAAAAAYRADWLWRYFAEQLGR
ncbi:MAG: TolC family protein [Flavobacteriales bacterium]|nr:TolC family protein [Flavobacteriales bacterium]